MIVATPVDAQERSAGSWGRAHWVAVAALADGEIENWTVHHTNWDELHDVGSHGAHHARMVRFLTENRVEAVVVDHMGEGMRRVMEKMGIPLLQASPGDAKASVLASLALPAYEPPQRNSGLLTVEPRPKQD